MLRGALHGLLLFYHLSDKSLFLNKVMSFAWQIWWIKDILKKKRVFLFYTLLILPIGMANDEWKEFLVVISGRQQGHLFLLTSGDILSPGSIVLYTTNTSLLGKKGIIRNPFLGSFFFQNERLYLVRKTNWHSRRLQDEKFLSLLNYFQGTEASLRFVLHVYYHISIPFWK